MQRAAIEKPDIDERGAGDQRSSRRLYMHLMVMTGCEDAAALGPLLERHDARGTVYQSLHDPWGAALLTMSEDPAWFVGPLRELMREPGMPREVRHEHTMFGRTYALGYEQDLEETLFTRPTRTALTPDWPWAVWYPLRRKGEFERLDASEQREILMEHGKIGMQFGRNDLAHDIRLACHGLDPADNDFVIGLTGSELAPLSAVVQSMRGTTQTSMYLERLGPFFVGQAVWQSPMGEEK